MNEIRDAMLIFVLKEMEHQTTGLPLNDEVLSGLLWVKNNNSKNLEEPAFELLFSRNSSFLFEFCFKKINKTISNDILKEWMKRCNEIIEHRGII